MHDIYESSCDFESSPMVVAMQKMLLSCATRDEWPKKHVFRSKYHLDNLCEDCKTTENYAQAANCLLSCHEHRRDEVQRLNEVQNNFESVMFQIYTSTCFYFFRFRKTLLFMRKNFE